MKLALVLALTTFVAGNLLVWDTTTTIIIIIIIVVVIIIIINVIAKPLWNVASLHCGHGGYNCPSSYEETFRRQSRSESTWSTRGPSPSDIGLPTSGKVHLQP